MRRYLRKYNLHSMKNFLLPLLCVLVVGCSKEPVSVASTSNPEVVVETLFEHDGCDVFRFTDAGRFHYFARCVNSTEVINTYSESCGLGCIRQFDGNIRTEYK